ncbi:MAG TPA: YihY/virulence factor BrkB family protein [Segeticoccus sp.]|uniref:YihY/virulence factor BrkB family protein n=1 Tax=Segeticoccus sp. TaxID=2706531 RepID=UPI002D801D60|nr:YihY/virulence factor BrkB family protein [Segeticoccus sp.]HET8598705.1 YihY/virulence factor BrkB family protein [Segeticoccus sp.]
MEQDQDTTSDRPDRRRAPDPEHPSKVTSPTKLHRPAWTFAFKRALAEFSGDHCTDLAAALTYFSVQSLFPAFIAIVSLLGVFGQGPKTTDKLLNVVSQAGMGTTSIQNIRTVLEGLQHSQGAGFGLLFGLLGALWSASGYVGAFGRAQNRIYEIEEGRPFWKLRPIQLLVTLVILVLVALVAIMLVVSGPLAQSIGNVVGLGNVAVTVWSIAKWPVLLIFVAFIIALLYWATPNIKQPKFRWLSIGALFALVVWILASLGFGFYVSNFSSYNKTYGALAGVIVFLLWLWITNIALLLGAELDSELERGRELQAGLPAAEELQLPPRDAKGIEKKEAKQRKAVVEARKLRDRYGRHDDRRGR